MISCSNMDKYKDSDSRVDSVHSDATPRASLISSLPRSNPSTPRVLSPNQAHSYDPLQEANVLEFRVCYVLINDENK